MNIEKVIFIDAKDVYETFDIACVLGENFGFKTLNKEVFFVAKHINSYNKRIRAIQNNTRQDKYFIDKTEHMKESLISEVEYLSIINNNKKVKYTDEYKNLVLFKLILRFKGQKRISIKDADKIF